MIANQEGWQSYVDNNTDPYGKACIDVARRVMELLDEDALLDPDKLITQADREALGDNSGITGFMAGCVAAMVSQCHSRGEEFRRAWNLSNQIEHEGERANDSGGILNPALLRLKS